MPTTKELYEEIKREIPNIQYNKYLVDKEICLPSEQLAMLKELLLTWNENKMADAAKRLLNDILMQPNNQNGKVYEALVYAWLSRQSVRYEPQVHINKEECFKQTESGYEADGMILENSIIFDVKQFGVTLPHIETLKRKLQAKIPNEYYLTISGGKNISTRDIQTDLLEKFDEIANAIMHSENMNHTDYIYRDKKYGLEFRAWKKESNKLYTSISEFNLYEWAENNEFYFMYHASQFCLNTPYILFCPFDKSIAHTFSKDDVGFTNTALRALCRRIFINLVKMDNRKINEFDRKAMPNISVSTASRKISAIVFMDVSEEYDYSHCRTFVFQNPNADCKIHRYQIDTIFRYAGAFIEDFQFDNY